MKDTKLFTQYCDSCVYGPEVTNMDDAESFEAMCQHCVNMDKYEPIPFLVVQEEGLCSTRVLNKTGE